MVTTMAKRRTRADTAGGNPEENKLAGAGAVPKGTVNPNNRDNDVQNVQPVPWNDGERAITVTVRTADADQTNTGGVGGTGATRGMDGRPTAYRNHVGFSSDDPRNPNYYSAGAIEARRNAARAEREEKRAKFNAVADRMNAATARRDQREAEERARRKAEERAKYNISKEEWEQAGARNGQLRTETIEQKNDDGSLVMGADGKPVATTKTYRNEGSMFDASKNADAVAAVEKWWKDSGGAYTDRHGVPKGVFDKDGKLQTGNLTQDQFNALMRLRDNHEAKMAPIRQRIQLNDAQNYLDASDYLQNKGVQVWDTKTGERKLSKEQVMQMAQAYRLGDAREQLKSFGDAGARNAQVDKNWSDPALREVLGDEVVGILRDNAKGTAYEKDRAALISRLRDLGFSTGEMVQDNGDINPEGIARGLRQRESANPIARQKAEAEARKAATERSTKLQAAARRFAEGMGADQPTTPPDTLDPRVEALAEMTAPGGALDQTPQVTKPVTPESLGVKPLATPEMPAFRPLTAPAAPAAQSPSTAPAAPATQGPLAERLAAAPTAQSFNERISQILATPGSTMAEYLDLPAVRGRAAKAARRQLADREAKNLADVRARTPSIGAPTGRSVPVSAVVRAARDTQQGQGSPEAMWGGKRNPLVIASEIAGPSVLGQAVKSGVKRAAGRAAARVAANPGVRRAVTQAEKEAGMNYTQRMMQALDNFKNSAPSRVAARDAAQKAVERRAADAVAEAAKSGAQKTLEAAARHNRRVLHAKPRVKTGGAK